MEGAANRSGDGGSSGIGRETWVEVAAYAGVAVALAGTGASVARAQSSEGATFAVLVVVTGVLVASGLWIGNRQPDAYQRMRSVFWFLGSEVWSVASTLLVRGIVGMSGRAGAALSALLTAIVAVLLWTALRRSLQHFVLFGALLGVMTALTLPQFTILGGFDLTPTAVVAWIYGIAWLFLSYGGLIQPRRTGMVLGAIAAIVGPMLFTQVRVVGEALSVLTAIVVLVVGERLDDRAVSGIGIVGLLLAPGVIVIEHLGDSTSGSFAALVGGAFAFTASLAVVGRGAGGGPPSSSDPSEAAAAPVLPTDPSPGPTPKRLSGRNRRNRNDLSARRPSDPTRGRVGPDESRRGFSCLRLTT